MSEQLYRNALKVAAVLDDPAITVERLKKVVQLCSVYMQAVYDRGGDTTLSTLLWATSVLADQMMSRDQTVEGDWSKRAYASAWRTWKHARIEAERIVHGEPTVKTLVALGEMEKSAQPQSDPATEWFEKGWLGILSLVHRGVGVSERRSRQRDVCAFYTHA